MSTELAPKSTYYPGIFLVCLSTMMLQILLTRIFSAAVKYHFAFVAISIAMFGMTVGALIVYLRPRLFQADRAPFQLAIWSLGFSLTIVLSFLLHRGSPLSLSGAPVDASTPMLILTYLVIATPFVFSGVVVTVLLTQFTREIGRLYAADLTGAATGCLLLILTLRLTDGVTAIFVVATFAAGSALLFVIGSEHRALTAVCWVAVLALIGLSASHHLRVERKQPSLELRTARAKNVLKLYEKWSSFAYVKVYGDPRAKTPPRGWGLSTAHPRRPLIHQLGMNIDNSASTVLTAFDGDTSKLDHLRWDVTNLVHEIRSSGDVMVIGAGGGRDVLSALAFGQRSVTAIEFNGDILDVVNREFADFTGHLYRDPRVTFVHDEARSYVARSDRLFDVIQVSLVDTWAATAAGAFALTENALYTLEAWEDFLSHLTDRGVVSFSHWYAADSLAMYRLTGLASEALRRRGIYNPRSHIVLIASRAKTRDRDSSRIRQPVGTVLVGKAAFTAKELAALQAAADRLAFDVVLTPEHSKDPAFERIAAHDGFDDFVSNFPADISPPVDDRPFFFSMIRARDLLTFGGSTGDRRTAKVTGLLVRLLATVAALTFLFVFVPLLLGGKRGHLSRNLPLLGYFASIGFGFMLIEVSQIQRLALFLGHPVYGLSVVLFSLLLASGVGSALTSRISVDPLGRAGLQRLGLLVGVLIVFGVLTPVAIELFRASATPIRIAVAVMMLVPIGVFMGMAFPMGMSHAGRRAPDLAPWLWGINGATSVCASVVGTMISLLIGISSAFWVGVACYALSWVAFARSMR